MRSLEGRLEGAVIALVALACLAFQLQLPARLPDVADYEQVQKVLETEARPGDVLLVYPWWAERARLYAPQGLTVVGYQGSDFDALELHPRIWVLAQPELPRASWSRFLAAFADRRTPLGGERVFGHLHLSLYQNGRHTPVRFSATDALERAQVYIESPDGVRTACSWDGRSHRCGSSNDVAAEWHEVRFQPRRCLRLFPPGGASKLVLELTSVAAADGLSLSAGYLWDRGYFHDPRLTATRVQAEVNGQSAASLELPPGEYRLQRAQGPSVPEGATVRVWTQAQNPELREVCVELYGVGNAP